MDDLLIIFQSIAIMLVSWMVNLWALVYPLITGFTALIAFLLAMHSLAHLVWRWYHHENTITDRHNPS